MPGSVVGRVAKGALGMWTEVHFPNGDRMMVSLASDEMKIWKLSHRLASSARKRSRQSTKASLDALAAQSSGTTRGKLMATAAFSEAEATLTSRSAIPAARNRSYRPAGGPRSDGGSRPRA